MKKSGIIFLIIIIIGICLLFLIFNKYNNNYTPPIEDNEKVSGILDINKFDIIDIDGNKTNYKFIYDNEEFFAIYTLDNWKIINSYKISNLEDMSIICTKLIEIHPIHGRDMNSFRTVEDMTYEWAEHNLAYLIIPNDNPWKLNAKDVDFDPYDQGKNIIQIYEDRTGKKFEDILKNK